MLHGPLRSLITFLLTGICRHNRPGLTHTFGPQPRLQHAPTRCLVSVKNLRLLLDKITRICRAGSRPRCYSLRRCSDGPVNQPVPAQKMKSAGHLCCVTARPFRATRKKRR
ncbi:hypothetical protein IWX50DRAFT_295357 [Phyllosticta citricarpa]